MRLTTVLSSVNNNSRYYMFIPFQIKFWAKFKVKFIAVFVGDKIPKELEQYKDNIILWNRNRHVKSAFLGQNLRIYYPALLNLPDNEMVMITDMDIIPTNYKYYKKDLNNFVKRDFIYYRNIAGNQIYMCYNAAHPSTWGKVFGIKTINDVASKINETYQESYSGNPGGSGWYIDQLVMYRNLIKYPYLKVLNRPIKRLDHIYYRNILKSGKKIAINNFDDVHFHRSYHDNKDIIYAALLQFNEIYK